MVKPTPILIALVLGAAGCGASQSSGTSTTAAPTAESTAESTGEARAVTYQGNRVPETPWWQVEPDPSPDPGPPAPAEETFEVSSDLLFAVSSARLGPSASSQLQHVLDTLLLDQSATVEIVGHTDNTPGPTPDYNQKLSLDRAEAVRTWLLAGGAAADRIATDGRADGEPAATNDTPAGRAANRRVTITIRRST
jgi:outer membrane protein OmpA-like peptidoglycan-associated protein